MKKLILSCVAALGLFAMVACSSPATKVADNLKDATEQLNEVNGDTAKVNAITKELTEKNSEITKDLSAEDQKEMLENEDFKSALADFIKAYAKAAGTTEEQAKELAF